MKQRNLLMRPTIQMNRRQQTANNERNSKVKICGNIDQYQIKRT
jgi:hypothetical protein